MAKVKDIISVIQKHRRSLLFIVFICAIARQSSTQSAKASIGIARSPRFTTGYFWTRPHNAMKVPIPLHASDPQPSSNGEPAFDVAFADPDGKLVTAGRGSPGWTIRISSNGAMLGETKASPRGEWVFEPNEPLAPGNYALSLLAIEPQSQRTISRAESNRVAGYAARSHPRHRLAPAR